MSLKDETRARLEAGGSAADILDLVRDHKSRGTTQRQAYDDLHELWRDYGFDDDDQSKSNPIRDELEYVMEVVWGFCPEKASIWQSSLSNRHQPT